MIRNKPLIVAHRGASYKAPENTIAAFKLAFEEKADFIEADFWLSGDDEIVCIHDSNTSRVGNKKLMIKTSQLSELKKLDVGSWKNQIYAHEKIPSLKEVMQIIPDGKGIQIEIKDNREKILIKLKQILNESTLFHERIRIISFHRNIVRAAKKHLPEIKSYLIFGWYFSKGNYFKLLTQRMILKKLKTVFCDGVVLYNNSYIDESFIKILKDKNLNVCVYNVDREADAVRLSSLGVDAITTDSPLKIREAIG